VLDNKWPQTPWAPLLLCGHSFRNATVGFLGFGRIAQATLLRMIPFGISRCIYTTSKIGSPIDESNDFYSLISSPEKSNHIPIVPASSYEELARDSDVLFVCCSLNSSTYHLVNKDFLKVMKNTAVVVNTARGGVVDSDDLADVLRDGVIAAAGLDVIEGEPNVGSDHRLVKEHKAVVFPVSLSLINFLLDVDILS
jgi:glyoxylate/hydroxypyruvate reductase